VVATREGFTKGLGVVIIALTKSCNLEILVGFLSRLMDVQDNLLYSQADGAIGTEWKKSSEPSPIELVHLNT
jgi:hypothetical protein